MQLFMLPPPVHNLHVALRRRPAVAEQLGVRPRREDDGVEPEQEDEGDHHRVLGSASKSSIRRFVITEKAPSRAFSWLKAATTSFTFKTLLRHYAKRATT